jgi:hypothetical protein
MRPGVDARGVRSPRPSACQLDHLQVVQLTVNNTAAPIVAETRPFWGTG